MQFGMKYRFTPINILCLFFLGIVVYYQTESKDVIDKYAAPYLFIILAFGMTIDLIIQKLIKNYKAIIVSELVLIALLVFGILLI